jgi:hypothetical protein
MAMPSVRVILLRLHLFLHSAAPLKLEVIDAHRWFDFRRHAWPDKGVNIYTEFL